MATNDSEYAIHLTNKVGEPVCVLPGEDIPDWAKVTNPLAVGESDSGEDPPPRAGRGSGAEPWAAYAAANGVVVEDGAGRDDIIAACEEAGVAVK